ncbi:tRNA (adenosine(37)-N6)-threonylcarbamoyltransferase complex transferase subunit TsaD, partial [Patescibacteria group bacterium]|nr:tRNA (adenosine(37)-N6)-threonylcarbamoyltransferase complex transferase subunit TsaD [Patescibacteria group bacterium]
MSILGIETSCDETAAAVVENGRKILSNVVASSVELHQKTGGIIPEIAAREQLKCIIPVIKEALQKTKKIDAIAVTVGPGLIGSLLVGVETAKTLAYIWKKP